MYIENVTCSSIYNVIMINVEWNKMGFFYFCTSQRNQFLVTKI